MTNTNGVWKLGTDEIVERDEWLANGFTDISETTIAFDDGTRTFTVNRTGDSFQYYVQGILKTVTTDDVSGSNTIVITDVEGVHAIYYVGDTLTCTANPTGAQFVAIVEDNALVSVVYWNATNSTGLLFDERHGYKMSQATHAYLHQTVGLAYGSGLALGDFVISDGADNEDAQFSIASGICNDEDLQISLTAVNATTAIPVLYRVDSDWRWTTQTGFKCITSDGTNSTRLAYDNAGTLTEVTDNDFVLVHIFASNYASYTPFAVVGQAEYATANLAREGAESEINTLVLTSLPLKELKPIATVIFQTKDSYANDVNAKIVQTAAGDNYIDWRATSFAAGVSATDHGSLGGLADDDHAQYPLSAGRSGGQTVSGDTDASGDLTLQSTANATKGGINLGSAATVKVHETLGAISIGKDQIQGAVAGVTVTGKVVAHVDDGNAAHVEFVASRHEDTTANIGSVIYGARARGDQTTPAIVQSGDRLFSHYGMGFDGTDWEHAAAMHIECDGTPGAGDMPGRITFTVTPDGSATPVEAMRISQDKSVTMAGALNVSGTTDLDGAVTINESGADVDFRVEGNAEANLLFADASTDRIGINTSSPSALFNIDGAVTDTVDGASNSHYALSNSGVDYWKVRLSATGQKWGLDYNSGGTFYNAIIIDRAGNVGIGETSPAAKLDVDNASDTLALRVDRAGSTATNAIAEFVSNVTSANTTHCKIMCDGDLENTNNAYGAISDEKLKDNIIDTAPKLADILKLKVRNFNFKDNPGLKQIGLIAQELEQVFPGLVKESPDYETIPDPDWKPQEIEVPVMETVTVKKTSTVVERINSRYTQRQITEEVQEEQQRYKEYKLYDEKGNKIQDGNGNDVLHKVPVTQKVMQTEDDRPMITRPTGTTTKSVKYSIINLLLLKAFQELAAKIGSV